MAFCTDDREPEHIAEDGHINARCATRSPRRLGRGCAGDGDASSGPLAWTRRARRDRAGYQADLLLLPDLERFVPEIVLKRGRRSRRSPPTAVPEWVTQSVRIRPVEAEDFQVPWDGGRARVIGLVPGQIVTEALVEELQAEDGAALADPERDLAKIAVIERHLGTGRIGLGFVRGFGLRRGHSLRRSRTMPTTSSSSASTMTTWCALSPGSSSWVAGSSSSMGARSLRSCRSRSPGSSRTFRSPSVIEASKATVAAVHALGSEVSSPFQSLAFLALSVIPSLKITDHGLVDVDRFELVPSLRTCPPPRLADGDLLHHLRRVQ